MLFKKEDFGMKLMEFLEYNNSNLGMYNPKNKKYGITLLDLICKKADHNKRCSILKYTCYDKKLKQCVQHIYAYKSSNEIIEIMRRFESYPSIWRTAYFSNSGTHTGLHPIFGKTYAVYYLGINEGNSWEFVGEEIEKKLKLKNKFCKHINCSLQNQILMR